MRPAFHPVARFDRDRSLQVGFRLDVRRSATVRRRACHPRCPLHRTSAAVVAGKPGQPLSQVPLGIGRPAGAQLVEAASSHISRFRGYSLRSISALSARRRSVARGCRAG